jgi:tellurite resistance protein TerB
MSCRNKYPGPSGEDADVVGHLAMSDDLSRANAMDWPIVKPGLLSPTSHPHRSSSQPFAQSKGATMPDAKHSSTIEIEISEPSRLNEQAVVALVIAGALVAVADRRVSAVERDEVIRFIRDRGLAPHISEDRLFAMFDELAERLEQPDFANVVIDTLRPVSDMSLSSHLIDLSERVAAADDDVHPHEVQAIKLLRLLTLVLPRSKQVPSGPVRTAQLTATEE